MLHFISIRMRYLVPLFIAVCTALALAMVSYLLYLYGSTEEPMLVMKIRPQLTVALVLGFVLVAVLISWVVWWVSSYYRDVTSLHEGLAKIKEGNFTLRITGKVNREFSLLAEAYNDVVTRLEQGCHGYPSFENIIESVAGLIMVTDRHDRIVLANAAACELTGQSLEALKGCDIFDFIAIEENSTADIDEVETTASTTTSSSDDSATLRLVDARLKTAGGYIPVSLSRGVLSSRTGEPDYHLYFSHETRESTRIVAELAERAEALKRYRDGLISVLEDSEMARHNLEDANREIQRVSQFKSQFLSNMSHELRTPLNNIIGYTDLTLHDKKHPIDKKHHQYLERAMANSLNLLDLINRVLDVTTFETGQIQMLRNIFPFRSLVDSTFATLFNLLRNKDVVLKHELADGLPDLDTDRVKLYGVIKNLLSNAIKFTEQGEVVLRALLHPKRKDWLRIQVADTGVGIAKEDQQAIFDDFRQLDGTSTRIYGGSGLGLSIALKFVHLLCGEIAVESHPGKGSTFTVDIPIHLPEVQGSDTAEGTI